MNFHSLKFVISTTSSKIDAHIGKYLMKSINPHAVSVIKQQNLRDLKSVPTNRDRATQFFLWMIYKTFFNGG